MTIAMVKVTLLLFCLLSLAACAASAGHSWTGADTRAAAKLLADEVLRAGWHDVPASGDGELPALLVGELTAVEKLELPLTQLRLELCQALLESRQLRLVVPRGLWPEGTDAGFRSGDRNAALASGADAWLQGSVDSISGRGTPLYRFRFELWDTRREIRLAASEILYPPSSGNTPEPAS